MKKDFFQELSKINRELTQIKLNSFLTLNPVIKVNANFSMPLGKVVEINGVFHIHPEDLMEFLKSQHDWNGALDVLLKILKHKIKSGEYVKKKIGIIAGFKRMENWMYSVQFPQNEFIIADEQA